LLYPCLVIAYCQKRMCSIELCKLILNVARYGHITSHHITSYDIITSTVKLLYRRDSGAGNGQSSSLIVGLGDYCGGELAVEGVVSRCSTYSTYTMSAYVHSLPFTPLHFCETYPHQCITPFSCITEPSHIYVHVPSTIPQYGYL
jgi:hypothetical protein